MKTADPRHNARRIAIATLFCGLFSEYNKEYCLDAAEELLELTKDQYDISLAQQLIRGVEHEKKEIDDIISACAPDWPIDKISKVDLIVLRVSIFELLYREDMPEKVVIDEAIEVGKEFGAETSNKFINGVLGTVLKIKKEIKLQEKEENND